MTARVRIDRTVEWPDTDGAGHYHHSTVIRWVEAAEAELYQQLGLLELFGSAPRVHYEVDYLARLYFRDMVSIELTVAEVGRTSMRYEFTVTTREGRTAARGAMVCVNSDPSGDEAAVDWPDEVRSALLG